MEHIIKELVKSGFSMHYINEARKTMTPEEFSTHIGEWGICQQQNIPSADDTLIDAVFDFIGWFF